MQCAVSVASCSSEPHLTAGGRIPRLRKPKRHLTAYHAGMARVRFTMSKLAVEGQNQTVKLITICDRGSDIFDFFHLAKDLDAKVLVSCPVNKVN